MTLSETIDAAARAFGMGAYHAGVMYRDVFKKGDLDVAAASAFARPGLHAAEIRSMIRFPECRVLRTQSDGGVVKFATRLGDGNVIESVVLPGAHGRVTVCVSSQVGCARGCRFCATGAMGLTRNLTIAEIVWQVWATRFVLGHNVSNVVFMGMGEPLDNVDDVIKAIAVIGDQRGLDIAPSHVTVSTAGNVNGIVRLAAIASPRPHLAVSLNAARDDLRSELMPINRQYPLTSLRNALVAYPFGTKGAVFVEYVLFDGVNDSPEDADEVAAFLDGIPSRVNLIPCNSGGPEFRPPSAERIAQFRRRLEHHGLFVRVRPPAGRAIRAGCGQLASAGLRCSGSVGGVRDV